MGRYGRSNRINVTLYDVDIDLSEVLSSADTSDVIAHCGEDELLKEIGVDAIKRFLKAEGIPLANNEEIRAHVISLFTKMLSDVLKDPVIASTQPKETEQV